MNKQTLLRATLATLLGLAVIAGGGKSYAADADDVKASIDGFHAALRYYGADATSGEDCRRPNDQSPHINIARDSLYDLRVEFANRGRRKWRTVKVKVSQAHKPHRSHI